MTVHLKCFYPQEYIHERYRKYSYFHRPFMPMQQTINKHVNGISQHFFFYNNAVKKIALKSLN